MTIDMSRKFISLKFGFNGWIVLTDYIAKFPLMIYAAVVERMNLRENIPIN